MAKQLQTKLLNGTHDCKIIVASPDGDEYTHNVDIATFNSVEEFLEDSAIIAELRAYRWHNDKDLKQEIAKQMKLEKAKDNAKLNPKGKLFISGGWHTEELNADEFDNLVTTLMKSKSNDMYIGLKLDQLVNGQAYISQQVDIQSVISPATYKKLVALVEHRKDKKKQRAYQVRERKVKQARKLLIKEGLKISTPVRSKHA